MPTPISQTNPTGHAAKAPRADLQGHYDISEVIAIIQKHYSVQVKLANPSTSPQESGPVTNTPGGWLIYAPEPMHNRTGKLYADVKQPNEYSQLLPAGASIIGWRASSRGKWRLISELLQGL